jgi:Mg-chelatase subunit ChlD
MNWIGKLFFLPEPPPSGAESDEGPPAVMGVAGCISLCFLILLDNSGSMQDRDIPPCRILAAYQAVLQLLRFLLDKLPQSYVGIGTFADDFHLCTNPRRVGAELDALAASLAELGDSGATEMRKGLLGIQQMMQSCPAGAKVVVIMLTDGHNTGRSPLSVAQDEKAVGADIWTIGIGGSQQDVDEDLLQKIASTPEHYSFIGNWEGPEAIARTFLHVAGLYFSQAQE